MKTIELTDKEYTLLLSVLNDAYELRAEMRCNDAYPNEHNLFTDEERLEMSKIIDRDEETKYLGNFDYPKFLLEKIKSQHE